MRKHSNETVTPRALDPFGAALYANSSASTFAKMRMLGTGPRFIKNGAKVSYLVEDLDAWLDAKPRLLTTAEAEKMVA